MPGKSRDSSSVIKVIFFLFDAFFHLANRAVKYKRTFVENQDAFTHLLDIGCVVRGKKEGCAMVFREFDEEVADHEAGVDVQTSGRFIQEQNARLVQEAGHDLTAHALSGKAVSLACAAAAQVQRALSAPQPVAVRAVIQLVDLCQQVKGVCWREMVPELCALAERSPPRSDS